MKIAVFTYEWNGEIVNDFCKGIQSFLSENPDIDVHMFDGFGKYGGDEAIPSDYEIFHLTNINQYDGIIIQGNRAWTIDDRMKIVENAKVHSIPIVSINVPLDGCILVQSDNYGAMKEIVNHLIQVHHVHDFVYLAGLKTSYEARQREQAFIDCCDENHIDQYIMYDTKWNEEDGREIANKIMNQDHLPEAIVCANDDLAFGCADELEKNGIYVPEEILVTGFDNLAIAQVSRPRLTTSERDYYGLMVNALNTIFQAATEKNIKENEIINHKGVFKIGKSCGCQPVDNQFEKVRHQYLKLNRNVKKLYRYYDVMKHELENKTTLSQIMDVVEKRFPEINATSIYLVMNGAYLDIMHERKSVSAYGDTMYLMGVSDGRDYTYDQDHVYDVFTKEQLLPKLYQKEERFLHFLPLHYEDTNMGYLVYGGFSEYSENNMMDMLLQEVASAIERLHHQMVMQKMTDDLRELSIKDQQTGLYNRFGLQNYAVPFYEDLCQAAEQVYVSFIDIDQMKVINDMYGHDAGDEAIKITANIINEVIEDKHAIAIRFGGDEFVVISEDDISDCLANVYLKFLDQHTLSFDYAISHGIHKILNEEHESLEEAINNADDSMYSMKRIKQLY